VVRGVRRWTPQRGDASASMRAANTFNMMDLLQHSCIKEVRVFFGSRILATP